VSDDDADYRDAILELADTLPDGVTWAVTGSANLALQGVDLDSAPEDVDVLCDEPGAYTIEVAFSAESTELVSYREDPEKGIASHYGALDLDGVCVEIVGDAHYRAEGGDGEVEWVPGADVAEEREFVDVDGSEVPVMPLEAEREGYEARGEEERVALLDDHP
jgi:hypothetical protein